MTTNVQNDNEIEYYSPGGYYRAILVRMTIVVFMAMVAVIVPTAMYGIPLGLHVMSPGVIVVAGSALVLIVSRSRVDYCLGKVLKVQWRTKRQAWCIVVEPLQGIGTTQASERLSKWEERTSAGSTNYLWVEASSYPTLRDTVTCLIPEGRTVRCFWISGYTEPRLSVGSLVRYERLFLTAGRLKSVAKGAEFTPDDFAYALEVEGDSSLSLRRIL